MSKLPQLRPPATKKSLTRTCRRRIMREDGFVRDVSVWEAFLCGMFAAYLLAAWVLLLLAE